MTHPVRKLRRAVFQSTAVVVFVLGFMVVMGLSDQEIAFTESLGRKPASIEPSASASARSAEVAVVSVDCARQDYEVPAVNHVQLQFKICPRHLSGQLQETHVQNQSNLSTATLFRLSSDTWTTDYLPVTPGFNQVSIRHYLNTGERFERIVQIHTPNFNRNPASEE